MPQNTAGQTVTTNVLACGTDVVGKIVFDATAIVAADWIEVPVGFKPSYIVFENYTDGVKGEWYFGMPNDSAIKTIANGTRTVLSSNAITPTERGFRVSQNATTAFILASKTIQFRAAA